MRDAPTMSERVPQRRPPRPRFPRESRTQGSESAAIAAHLLRTARGRGIDITGLEARFALPLDRPVDVICRLPLARTHELWEELLRRSLDRWFSFEAATIPFPESVALFVFVTTSRQTVRDALELLVARSTLITTSVRFELEVTPRSATLRVIGPDTSRLGACASVEFLIGHLLQNLLCATGERCRPRRVQFAHEDDSGGRRLPTVFGPVLFGGSGTFIELEPSDLALPLDVIDGLAQILGSRVDPPDLISRVRNAIELSLAASGRASIGPIARTVGLTPRTLQRQLPSGTTFHALVQGARRELALALVRARPDLPIKEIATRVGFASPRAFSRAYHRWTGSPPATSRVRRRVSRTSR